MKMGLNFLAQIAKMQYWVGNYFIFDRNNVQMFWEEAMPRQLFFQSHGKEKNLTRSFCATTGGQWWEQRADWSKATQPCTRGRSSLCSSLLVSKPFSKSISTAQDLKAWCMAGVLPYSTRLLQTQPPKWSTEPHSQCHGSAIWECQPESVSQSPPLIKETGSEWLPWRVALSLK